jgi:hypothetical protein
MKLYFAGLERFKPLVNEADRILIAFADKREKDLIKFIIKNKRKDFLIDSGGYSVRVSGTKVDVKKYGSFLEKIKNNISVAVNLDTNDYNETQANLKYLTGLGLKILPVFHYSDIQDGHKSLLDEYLEKYDYIGIGGIAGVVRNRNNQSRFFNYCFSRLKKYNFKKKIHAFGITSPRMLMKYPFYSSDSTTWLMGGKGGIVYQFKNLKLNAYSKAGKPKKENVLGYLRMDKVNINELIKYEKFITNLWKSRGIEWT